MLTGYRFGLLPLMFALFVMTLDWYNAFNVYCRELAPGTVSLTGDRAQGDDSKHWAYSIRISFLLNIWITNGLISPNSL